MMWKFKLSDYVALFLTVFKVSRFFLCVKRKVVEIEI